MVFPMAIPPHDSDTGRRSVNLVVPVKLADGMHVKAESNATEVEQRQLEQSDGLNLPLAEVLDISTISPETHLPSAAVSPASTAS